MDYHAIRNARGEDAKARYNTPLDTLPVKKDLDKFRGCLIGGAAGDALGYTVEFLSEPFIRSRFGPEGIREYRLKDGLARISDDTQMTLFTANGLLFGETRGCLRGIRGYPASYVAIAYREWYKTQIESFKLLQINEKWYLYDFEAEAQYVKVHYTHFDNEESSFIGFFGQMIHASYEEVFGGGKETFTKSEYSLTNNGATKYDYAWTISKKALGITGSDASIRISLDGKLLYHYVDDENVIVRIPEVAAGASVKLTVQQSESTDVLNIANKENVYEITYGYRESYVTEKRPWYMTSVGSTRSS